MKFRKFEQKGELITNWISKHLDLIDDNKFKELYDWLIRAALPYHKVTEMFYEAGIEPLEYLDYVPEDYLSNSQTLIEVEIREGITTIKDSAFFGCVRVNEIELPKSILNISDYALAGMDNLESIYIPGKLNFLSPLAIWENPSLEKIYSIAENKELLFQHVTELKNSQAKFVEID